VKVLIAEDSLVTSMNLNKNISSWGYQVVTARNGWEAWNLINKDEIRLAILDWMMPGIDGLQLCKKIRQEQVGKKSKYIYIILLTGKDQQEDIIAGLSAGADDYMVKPANLLELKVRLLNGSRIIELEDKRIQLASYDSLTHLWNRSKIFEFLEEELDRTERENQETGIIMIDIDNFKHVNDTHGHYIGDLVLKEVAVRLKNSIRRYDKIGRYGGDEMLIVLPHCNLTKIARIAERLRLTICEKDFKTDVGNFSITISLGGASTQSFSNITLENMLQASDRALYLAKKHGRNRSIVEEVTNAQVFKENVLEKAVKN
jgi:two-component system cell cycle response regulator